MDLLHRRDGRRLPSSSIFKNMRALQPYSRTKQAAYDENHNVVDTGQKIKLLKNYIDRYAKAHQTLVEARVEIQEDKKLDNLPHGLADPSICIYFAEAILYGNSDLRNNFRSCTE
jgi:hypothetical protein